jgi:arylsulfatase
MRAIRITILARLAPFSTINIEEFMTGIGGKNWLGLLTLIATAAAATTPAPAQQTKKPNILVIMADDIGYWNITAYNRGMMGYHTPNIDRIANEGAIFTDYYGQQSCPPAAPGLLKVGLPAAKEGLSEKDPTIAELLKPQGYATAQFGKNHLGDRNEFLPTVHGFDEFFGSLYHLNAEDEPEHPDYPKNPAFMAQFGPRGVMKCFATSTDTPGDDPRFRPWGKQKCEDTGPLIKKRMETIDEEFVKASLDFIDRANRDKKPFFVWFNPTRMHIWTRLKPESQGVTGLGLYPDGMVEHDGQVGQLLKKLDDLGITNNTIVIHTTDNGAATFSWLEQKAEGFDVWQQLMVQLRLPMLFNLRSDPFERAQHQSGDYVRWFVEHAFVVVPAQAIVGQYLASFQQFPPRQRPGSFSVEQAMEKLRNPSSDN